VWPNIQREINPWINNCQAFFLDAIGLLVEIVETIHMGQKLTIEDVEEQIKGVLTLPVSYDLRTWRMKGLYIIVASRIISQRLLPYLERSLEKAFEHLT